MAKPTPLPIGRANPHIMESRGAEPYIMNFYCTNYSTAFTKPNTEFNKGKFKDIPGYTGNPEFKPRSAPLYATSGFTSNDRPQIYYKRSLDEYDNPQMGRLLADNYNTVTDLYYQPNKLPNGFEELPVKVQGQKTAFTQGAYNHNPRQEDVYGLYTDVNIRAPFDIIQNHKPRLFGVHNHDPIPKENNGYGPKFMSTEYATKYVEQKASEKTNPSTGAKESSGFVSNKEVEDVVTSVPGERWLFNSNRPTGISDYKAKYQPYGFPRSETALPNIMGNNKTRDSVYTKAFRPSEINPRGGFENNSEYKDTFIGKQEPDPKLSEKLGTSVVGPKEMSGHSHESGKVQTADDPRRFITNYQIKHYDMNPKGKDREGHVVGGVQNMKEDGFTKSTNLHNTGSLNAFADLYSMQSYQSRSIRATNPYYDDHTQDHKFSIKNKVVTFQHNNPYSVNS